MPFFATVMPPMLIFSLSRIGLLAGLADGHDDAAPVGVLAGDRRLHQRRIGDRHGDPVRGLVVLGTGDGDLDELLRTFAVLRHLVGEVHAEAVERLGEALEPGILRRARGL